MNGHGTLAADSASVDYTLLERQVRALLDGEPNFIARAANFAAFVYETLPDLNWAGFYFPDERGLVLGPFVGRPACSPLPPGRGVCGSAFVSRSTQIVEDVHAVADHIECDAASRSEIVVPLMDKGVCFGVFDIDSPSPARFTRDDAAGVERLVGVFVEIVSGNAGARHESGDLARVLALGRAHAALIGDLASDIDSLLDATAIAVTLSHLDTLLRAHLTFEHEWLFPRLARGENALLRKRVERLNGDVADLAEQWDTFRETWRDASTIAADTAGFRREWNAIARAIDGCLAAERDDLFVAAEPLIQH